MRLVLGRGVVDMDPSGTCAGGSTQARNRMKGVNAVDAVLAIAMSDSDAVYGWTQCWAHGAVAASADCIGLLLEACSLQHVAIDSEAVACAPAIHPANATRTCSSASAAKRTIAYRRLFFTGRDVTAELSAGTTRTGA
jgi:hypothetical protein